MSFLPLVSFEVFKLNAKHAVFGVGQHENVLVAKPKLSMRVAESVFVIVPVSVEILMLLFEIVPTLKYLRSDFSLGLKRFWIVDYKLFMFLGEGYGILIENCIGPGFSLATRRFFFGTWN